MGEEIISQNHQYFCVFSNILNIIGFSSPKQGIYDDINLSDDIDSYYSNIDSSSFKENLIDDNYLNYDNSSNYNDGTNTEYNYIIDNIQDIGNVKSDHLKSVYNDIDTDDDTDIDTDDEDNDKDTDNNNCVNDNDMKCKNEVKSETNDQYYMSDTYNNNFIIRPEGVFKKLWEIIGLVLLLWQLYDVVTGRYHHWLVHPIMDAYFILDIVLRFRTGYIDHNGRLITNPDKIRRRYLRGSFLIDLIISLPYGFLSDIWKNRPITKLVEIKSRFQQQPKKNILLNFIFNRPFRLEVIHTIKDHLFERKYYKAFRETTGIGLAVMPDRQKKPIQWIIRRTARILGFGFRVADTFKIVAYYSVIAKHIQGVAFSARSIILTWPMLRENIRPILLWKKLKRRLSRTSPKSD